MLRYVFYVIFLTVVLSVLLYLLFPEKVIKNHFEKHAELMLPGTTVETAKVSPLLFPPGVGIDEICIREAETLLIQLDSLNIYPQIFSFFSTKKTSYNFYGKVPGGRIEGTFKKSHNGDISAQSLNAKIIDLSVAEIPMLKNHASFKINGILNGQMAFNSKNVLEADLKLSLSKGQVELSTILLGQLNMDFIEVASVITVQDSLWKITKGHLDGKDMDISFSGNIRGNWPMIQSRLDFSGHINPHHSFFKKPENKVLRTFFPDKKASDMGFSFMITGTLENPVFVWN